MTEQHYIERMRAGAILHRADMGASTWCHLELPDGTIEQVSREPGDTWPLNETRPLPLEVLTRDSRGIPTSYRLKKD